MSGIFIKKHCSYFEPMEALVTMFEDGSSLQEMVNLFLKSKVSGYGRNRICNLLRNYVRLVEAGEYERPTDIELDEDPGAGEEGVDEPFEIFVRECCSFMSVMDAIIFWYEHDVSIVTMLERITKANIHSYTRARVQNLLKIYKAMKKKGEDVRGIDVELNETGKGTAPKANPKKAAKAAPKKSARTAVKSSDKSFKKVKFNNKTGEFFL